MKVQIRQNLFETNSSSIHTITISKNGIYNIPDKIHFSGDDFGWEVKQYSDCNRKACYLYTAIKYKKEDRDAIMKKIVKMLDKHNCKATYDPYNNNLCYIDHSEDLYEFLNTVLKNETTLLTYLFGDAIVYTYNDNMDYEYYDFYKKIQSLSENDYYIIDKGN